MSKTSIFITIRKDSSRLPEKAMRKILGRSVMELVISRAKIAKNVDSIIVCTSTRDVDDEIEDMALKCGVDVFRGSLLDKLERWNGAAKKFGVDYIVTFDGDDLFTEPELLDLGAKQITEGVYDFIESPKGIIPGAFTYAFTSKALAKACEIKDTDNTEMMWTYFKDTGLFKTGTLKDVSPVFFSEKIRATLDYPEDFEFFRNIFEHFKSVNNDVSLRKIVKYLDEHPEVAKINIRRQEEFLENQRKKTFLAIREEHTNE